MATFRKIIQIQACAIENTQVTQAQYMRVALCDDGSIWESYDWSPWQRQDISLIINSTPPPPLATDRV